MKKALFIIVFMIAFVWGAMIVTQAEDRTVEDLVKTIRDKYKTVDALKAHFAQKNFIASLNQFREFEGTIFLKRPHLFCMDVTFPGTQKLVFDDHYYWIYTESAEQVLKNPVPPNFVQHPLINLIHTMENLDQDFIVSQGITRSADEYSLTLTLKTPQSDIEGAHLTVGKKDFQIHELLLRYCSGNYTQFTLTETVENPSIPSECFQFTPPPGVEVIENPASTAQAR